MHIAQGPLAALKAVERHFAYFFIKLQRIFENRFSQASRKAMRSGGCDPG
jgi:hypothetical protein